MYKGIDVWLPMGAAARPASFAWSRSVSSSRVVFPFGDLILRSNYLAWGVRVVFRSRKIQASAACVLFLLIAQLYQGLSGTAIDQPRILLWSGVGIALYMVLSLAFGFDPYRSKLHPHSPPLLRYVERWELRSGTASLTMTLLVFVCARILDSSNLGTAFLSATLAAWVYFMLRVFTGGYQTAKESVR
jgi:hypothetical protein